MNFSEPENSRRIGNPATALLRRAKAEPDQTAFFFRDEAWSCERLAAESERLALALRARGVGPGDRVVLHMANLPELVTAYYACFLRGALAVPLNTRLKAAELHALLRRLRPSVYLGQDALHEHVASVPRDILALNTRFLVGEASHDGGQPWADLLAGTAAPPRLMPADPDPATPAVLLPTSGTTGEPKLVVHTPATLAAITESFAHLGIGRDRIVLLAMPMVHGAGFTIFLGCIHLGAQIILLERFDPDAALDAIETHRCDWMLGLPFMFADMTRQLRKRPRDVGSLKRCISAGDVCPSDVETQFAASFGVELRSVLASCEIAWSLTYGRKPGPISCVPPSTKVRIGGEDGTELPQGETGELMVRSASVTPGYWVGPGRIEDPLQDGWRRSGDLMRRENDDELRFIARKKEMIVRGGSNIAPAEVEQVLRANPAVQDAIAVGVPDLELGERVAALVQLVPGGDSADSKLDGIRTEAADQLADYKVPESLKAVDAIPRNAMGKLDRAAARKTLLDNHDGHADKQ